MLRTLQHFVRPRPVTRKYPYEKRDLPWGAAEIVAAEFGKTMTDLYTTASLLANFRGAPQGEGTAIPRGGRKYTGNLGVAGVWPEASPPPAHDELHEHEVHHALRAGIS